MMEPLYLGDGVYVKPHPADPTAVILTTGHHLNSKADNVIVLEEGIIDGLTAYLQRFKNDYMRSVSHGG